MGADHFLRHPHWVGAPIPCCFENDIDPDEVEDAQCDAYVLEIDYGPAVSDAVIAHGGEGIYAISLAHY